MDLDEKDIRMENKKQKRRQAFVAQEECVACGCCVKVCPVGAIQIMKGIMAQVEMEKCIGFATMILFKPRSWCVYCPMGTMTQLVYTSMRTWHWNGKIRKTKALELYQCLVFRLETDGASKAVEESAVREVIIFYHHQIIFLLIHLISSVPSLFP